MERHQEGKQRSVGVLMAKEGVAFFMLGTKTHALIEGIRLVHSAFVSSKAWPKGRSFMDG